MTVPKLDKYGNRLRQPVYKPFTYKTEWGEVHDCTHHCPDCDALLKRVSNGLMRPCTYVCPNGHGEFDPYGTA